MLHFTSRPRFGVLIITAFFIFLQTAAVFILILKTEKIFGVRPLSLQRAVREFGRQHTEWDILHTKPKEAAYSQEQGILSENTKIA